jgi:hypothetical protein
MLIQRGVTKLDYETGTDFMEEEDAGLIVAKETGNGGDI